VPVAALYGGRTRERVRPYASSGGYHMTRPPEELWPDEVVRATEAGFDAFKLRIGRYAPERELAVIRSVRSEVGSGVDLAADGNGAYTLQEAVRVGRELDELGFLWLEEPTNRGRGNVRHPGYPGVADVLDIPIAGGEGLTNRSDYRVLMQSGAVDVVQPDVTICGGVGEALFVAELAALFGRWCIPHAWGGAVVLAATLQLLATVPKASEIEEREGPLLEYDIFENRMRTELATEPIEVRDGFVAIPDRPGLGIEVDEGFVARFDVLGRS
jgi:D-galactarolactone cycloisomerase